uniref:Formyl transferase N-terminal domain-containing protein n=2 Tax=Thermorudis TaxID=1649508 RepID=A0A7C2WSD5_9BACT
MSNRISCPTARERPRVLFFGRPCRLSALPLQALIESGIPVVAVVVPARRRDDAAAVRLRSLSLPVVLADREPALEQIASHRRIPILEASTLRHTQVLERLRQLEPDMLVVSCFPWRVPDELVALAPLGGLNLHPSALPAYRGPDPLFWIYRHGRLRVGVTIHQLTAELDAGPIVEQSVFDLPLGLPGDWLEREAARIGGSLLVSAIHALSAGRARSFSQPEEQASYFSWPRAEDLEIGPDWPAWRAVHFLNGVLPLGYQPVYRSPDGDLVAVRRLLRWCRTAREAGEHALVLRGSWLPLRDGVLVAEVALPPN